jgi:putative hydrolase of the HAD superfamily
MRVILWDFDGTLGYRSGGAWTASTWEVLHQEEPGCRVTQEQLRPYMLSGFPWHEPELPHPHIKTADEWWATYQKQITEAYLGVGFVSQRAQELSSFFRQTYLSLDKWRVYDDAIPVLESLSAAGWVHVILSNHVPELTEIVEYLGITSHFIYIFNSAETGYEKPHPRAFQIVLDTLPDLESIWMVGDNIDADVKGAMKVGIPAVLVHKHHIDADHFAETLYDVPVILNSVKEG